MKQNKTTAEKSALMCIFREGILVITLTCKLNDFFLLVRQINNDDDDEDDDEGWAGRSVEWWVLIYLTYRVCQN